MPGWVFSSSKYKLSLSSSHLKSARAIPRHPKSSKARSAQLIAFWVQLSGIAAGSIWREPPTSYFAE